MTTLRLWLDRRKAPRRAAAPGGQRRLALTALLAVGMLLITAAAVLLTRGPGSANAQGVTAGSRHTAGDPSARADPSPAPSQDAAQLQAMALTQGQAATWISQQVSPDAIVACDPAMCSALQARGLTASQLLVLRPGAADPLGSDIVVATAAIRSQFGASLAGVYAPLVIASFGSGPEQIDVRDIAPDGAAAFQAALAADHQARVTAGKQLARNRRITTTAAVRTALAGGDVDPRLLVVLAALSGQQAVRVEAFGDPSPGADGLPLRSAQLGAASAGKLRAMLSFLRAQRSPYLAAQIATVSGGRHLISIQFNAPSPLGLANAP